MQVIARRTLREFWARYPHAEGPIRAWVAIAAKARWANPAEIKRQFGSTVDFVGDNRIIFDLGGNKYRLVVHVSNRFGRLLVKFIGTHAEYDRIDPEIVSWRREARRKSSSAKRQSGRFDRKPTTRWRSQRLNATSTSSQSLARRPQTGSTCSRFSSRITKTS